ncbi:uncharacterized protein C8A04DRAFT_15890 [Dichotomopilus funicola]|uniref:Zn(2)-C6 fungal-type domain-containing protein n=1 Tax=Dichotomopilus funicola TaxID=1934379 RepID=A0AAN6UX22_9PEZI|nr:hypothetical protein C8A04DRAFT_15890 [Dichotomopilus funicola]
MEPEKRRRRPAVSCILCRKRKIRCDKQIPCSNCTKSKNATCAYKEDPRAPRAGDPSQLRGSEAPGPLSPSTGSYPGGASSSRPTSAVPSAAYSADALALGRSPEVTTGTAGAHGRPSLNTKSRTGTAGPETGAVSSTSAFSSANTPVSTFTKNSRVETKEILFAGNFYFHTEHRLPNQPQAVTRSTHSLSQLNDMFDVIERHLHNGESSKAVVTEKRCKALGKIIKARRAPPWPCMPTPELPARAIADALVECYLNTSESMMRVLHIPSFRRNYEAVWDPSHTPDPAFLVQLKLVLAIGSNTYDDSFSLRPHAMRWVYEGHTWLSAPEFKRRLNLSSLQSNVLLHLAREAAGVGEELVWAAMGTTLRIAMSMGLHRDPAGLGPKTTSPLVAEMRRRIWNTILELLLQSSLNAGGPPLIELDQFDTEPPGNYDDDQLTGEEGEAPVPRPADQFTQTTLAIALRNLFPQRLAIVKYLNDLSSRGAYAETLRLDTNLREAYKTLTRTLQSCNTSAQTPLSGGQPHGPSNLDQRVIDLHLRRYFLGLHLPFFAPALQETAFAFSRRVVVESALRLWRAVFPNPLSHSPDTTGPQWDPLQRIAISGAGFFRTVAVQSFVVIAIELKTLLREEEGFGLGPGPVELRPDLLVALQDFKVWSWKTMETGEMNTKGYLAACMVYAQVEALRKGLGDEEAVARVVREAEDAEEKCLALLEGIEASGRPPHEEVAGGVGGSQGISPDFAMEEWDYMVTLTPFQQTRHFSSSLPVPTPAAPITTAAQQHAKIEVTPLFPAGENVVFAHSSYFTRAIPLAPFGSSYPDLPSTARVRGEAARLGLLPSAEGGPAVKLVPFGHGSAGGLRLLVKYGPDLDTPAHVRGVGHGRGVYSGGEGGVSAAEGKAMMFVRRIQDGMAMDVEEEESVVPVPEVFGWRRDAETGERFVYMDMPEGDLLEERWAGMSEVEREVVATQLKGIVAEWRRLKLGGSGFVGIVDNGPLHDEIFQRSTHAGAPPAGPFPTVAAFHDYFVSVAVALSQSRHTGGSHSNSSSAGPYAHEPTPTTRYTPHHLFPSDIPVVFTHGALHPRNIIISGGRGGSGPPRVVAILGWDQAGWYPAYWELCKARAECARGGRLGGGWESKYLSWILDADGLNAEMRGSWNARALCQYWDYFVGLM